MHVPEGYGTLCVCLSVTTLRTASFISMQKPRDKQLHCGIIFIKFLICGFSFKKIVQNLWHHLLSGKQSIIILHILQGAYGTNRQ